MGTKAYLNNKETQSQQPGVGGGLVFWTLVALGVATLAPCVLLPEWRDHQAINAAWQTQQNRVSRLEQAVAHEKRILDAFRSDPAAVSRLAQRDLRFHKARDTSVSLPLSSIEVQDEDREFVPEPVLPPRFLAGILAHLPNWPYDRLFCEQGSREILMVMGVAIIGVAFVLFGRRRTSWS